MTSLILCPGQVNSFHNGYGLRSMKSRFAPGKIWASIKDAFKELSITQKIGYANALAIGLSISGTLVGLFVGDHYQSQAQEKLAAATQKETLLHTLDTCILKIRAHPQKLVATIEEPLWFRYEVGEFQNNVATFKALLSDINTAADQPEKSDRSLKQLAQDYQATVDGYTQRFETIWPQVNPLNLPSDQRSAAQMQVLTSLLEEEGRNIDREFEKLAGQLQTFRQTATERQKLANRQLEAANRLRGYIIVASLLLSIGTAIVLSLYTGRAITRPLKAVTQTAQQVTQHSNYDLQAPIETGDEVGILANSLNQLIAKVKQQIQQLAEGQRFLEERVEDRTRELQTTLKTLQDMQTQLIQSEKMSSLGEMVAGIAHEINNPVNFIHGNVTHAQDYLNALFELIALYQTLYPIPATRIQAKIEEMELDFIQSDFVNILASMQMGTQRIQEIVTSLRTFSRLDESEVKDINLHEGIDSTLLILKHRIGKQVEIIKHYGDLPRIYCYPAQLNQVFLNLIVNSIDALVDCDVQPKTITISTRPVRELEWKPPSVGLPLQSPDESTDKAAEDCIQISIQDNGPGIPPDIRKKIFNPFFTTKPTGRGTGLGLAICYRIIETHRGKIEVRSTLGKGTEFRITLPLHLSSLLTTVSTAYS